MVAELVNIMFSVKIELGFLMVKLCDSLAVSGKSAELKLFNSSSVITLPI